MEAQLSFISKLRLSWKEDLLASVVVFLVALPLSMGLALVAGFPFENATAVGIISGIIGGVVVGPLSGSPLQVSGAANGAAVMVAIFIKDFGFQALGLIVLLSGLIQLAAGLLRMGQVFRAVSPALIQGMLAGIGVLIFASQFHVTVDDLPPGAGKEYGGVINLWSLPQAVWKGVTEPVHRPAALIGLLTIATVTLWSLFAPKKLKLLPAPLIGVVVATAAAWHHELDMKYVPVPEQLLDAIRWPTVAAFSRLNEGAIWLAGLSQAFVASAESLLTATAADSMQRHAERTKYSRELAAQGVGNILCGLAGVLPITGVIVRTSANIMAGGRTRMSAFLHGVWLLLFVALLPGVLGMIPVAGLAAVLVFTGVKLAKLQFAKSLWDQDRAEAAIYVITLVGVVGLDLLTGIMLGIGLAFARLLYTFSHLEIQIDEEKEAGVTVVHLKGAATFIRLPQLAAAMEKLRPDSHLQVHLHELTFIDHACLDLLVNWEQQHKAAGGDLVLDWGALHGLFRENAWRAPEPPHAARPQRGEGRAVV